MPKCATDATAAGLGLTLGAAHAAAANRCTPTKAPRDIVPWTPLGPPWDHGRAQHTLPHLPKERSSTACLLPRA